MGRRERPALRSLRYIAEYTVALLIVCLVITCLAATVWAAPDKGVTVRSDSLQIQEKTGDIRFEGNVEVRMEGVVLSCDLLFVKTDSMDSSRIMSGQASGNVVMIRGADRVESQEAIFNLEAGDVELTGEPRLIREETIIEAERIVYSVEKGAATFFGPVRAIFKAPGD
jgi:lipopolysaccharide export system protein LptA